MQNHKQIPAREAPQMRIHMRMPVQEDPRMQIHMQIPVSGLVEISGCVCKYL